MKKTAWKDVVQEALKRDWDLYRDDIVQYVSNGSLRLYDNNYLISSDGYAEPIKKSFSDMVNIIRLTS